MTKQTRRLSSVKGSVPASPVLPISEALPTVAKRKKGGMKKSTDTTRSNARVSLAGDNATRRGAFDIKSQKRARKWKVNVFKLTAKRNLKNNGKNVLVPAEIDFFALNFSRMSTEAFVDALTKKPEEKVWIYVHERGVMQVKCKDISNADVMDAGIVPGTVMFGSSKEGKVRVHPQKVGTRRNPGDELRTCVELDFGEKIKEQYRTLWVEKDLLTGDSENEQEVAEIVNKEEANGQDVDMDDDDDGNGNDDVDDVDDDDDDDNDEKCGSWRFC